MSVDWVHPKEMFHFSSHLQNPKKWHLHKAWHYPTGHKIMVVIGEILELTAFKSIRHYEYCNVWGMFDLWGSEGLFQWVNQLAKHAVRATLGDLPESANHRQLWVGHSHVSLWEGDTETHVLGLRAVKLSVCMHTVKEKAHKGTAA